MFVVATTGRCGVDEVANALNIIERLLKWTRPGGQNASWVKLTELVAELRGLVEDMLIHDNIEFELDQSDASISVHVAPDSVRMALLDLLVNARKAMPNGGRLSVAVHKLVDGFAQLQISDTGEGMTEEQVQQLMVPNPTTPRPAGGTGLGLYLARRIINAAGGQISCDSKLGTGTTFTVLLPTEPMKEKTVV